MTARQVARSLATYSDDWKEPAEIIQSALKTGRNLDGDEWAALRDDAADDVAWLLAGADAEGTADVRARATCLLDQAHKTSGKEAKGKKFDLEKSVKQLIGKIGPLRMLQNALERDLAELLSNPRTAPAIQALLAARKKE